MGSQAPLQTITPIQCHTKRSEIVLWDLQLNPVSQQKPARPRIWLRQNKDHAEALNIDGTFSPSVPPHRLAGEVVTGVRCNRS